MKIIIAGGRNYEITHADWQDLDRLALALNITEVVSGKAPGADTGGEDWAIVRGIPVQPFPAEWEKYKRLGKKNPAGIIRNGEMAKYVGPVGAVVLFPGGSGTQNMYEQAKKHGLRIFDWRKEPREFP